MSAALSRVRGATLGRRKEPVPAAALPDVDLLLRVSKGLRALPDQPAVDVPPAVDRPPPGTGRVLPYVPSTEEE